MPQEESVQRHQHRTNETWWEHRSNNTNQDVFDERDPCVVCNNKFYCTQTPLQCPYCDTLCHQSFSCSKIPDYNTDLVWNWKDHADGANNHLKCARCPRNFGSWDSYKCQQCDLRVHKHTKFSKIPKGTKFPIWKCAGHDTPAPDPCLEYPICYSPCCRVVIPPEKALKCQDCNTQSRKV